MKKISLILQRICSIIIILVALIFMIIEGRLVFSGDWMLYEDAVFGFMQYCFRFLLAIVSLGIGLLPWIRVKSSVIPASQIALYGAIALFGMSLIYLWFATNYVGEVFWGISGVYLILSIICNFRIINEKI